MPKLFLPFLFMFFCSYAFSQNTVNLKGKVVDQASQLPIESATVYLTSVKDSTVIDYTITNKFGYFDFKIKKINQPLFLKVSYISFQDFKVKLESIEADKDFGTFALKESVNSIDEVVVINEAPPIRIKNDTLEFNASSFKLRPDANVEALLKQLPGVEVDSEGKITVNGKEVNQILVNGKPFFDKDGKIALQNLPSDIINKVQVTDTKTKKEELSGQAASANTASINLTIDEDKNKGFFGKFMGGYGTDDRYESSMLLNYFNNKRKISVLASSNNINATGFSMDEIFDNMSGGRNSSVYYNDNGSFGINGMRFGGGNGVTQSNMVGVNYSDELIKDFTTNGSYFFSNGHSRNVNKTSQINFLPTGTFSTDSNSKTNEDRYGHTFSSEFEYKIDSTTSFVITPKFSKGKAKFSNLSDELSTNETNDLLNESNSDVFTENDNNSFTNTVYFNKSFKKNGRFLSSTLQNENSKDIEESTNKSTTIFYQGIEPDDIRNQIKKSRNLKDEYFAEIEYSEPIADSMKVRIGIDYRFKKESDARNAFDFDGVSQSYSLENDVLTNYFLSTTKTVRPRTGFGVERKKFNFDLNLGVSMTQFDNKSLYLGNTTDLNKKYSLPYIGSYLSYRFTKSKSLYINYNYEVDFPSANQVLEVEDLANPLNTIIGNNDVNPNRSHSSYIGFRDFDYVSRSGYSYYFGGDLYDNQVVSSTTYDTNRKRTTTYENVSGTYNSWFGGSWNKSSKKESNKYKYTFGMSISNGLSKGFTDGELFEAKSVRITPRASFTYDYGELLSINPSYNFSYSETKYTNYVVSSASNFIHKLNLQTTSYWPKNWVFGNDFGYTYNSNIADGFKKDFYLWNTSLSYTFFNKKMIAKVKVYDMLNQNQNATRTITPTTIRDEENIVLKRYAMFSLTYKIEKFAGKEKKEGNGIMFF